MMFVTICVIAGHHFHFDFSSLAIQPPRCSGTRKDARLAPPAQLVYDV
jgi:hypothetical protein